MIAVCEGGKNLFEIYLKCSRGAQNPQGGGGECPPPPPKKNPGGWGGKVEAYAPPKFA